MRTHKLYFAAIFFIFCLLNVVTLRDGHNWGDDFSQYILHAVNLIEHRAYTEAIALDLWTVVPPGYPLLLSAVIYWFGINFKILKFINVVSWGLTALSIDYLRLDN